MPEMGEGGGGDEDEFPRALLAGEEDGSETGEGPERR